MTEPAGVEPGPVTDELTGGDEPDQATAYADLVLPVTGDPRVDDGLVRLTELAGLPVEEHLAVYQDVHQRLHDTLAALDPGGAAPR